MDRRAFLTAAASYAALAAAPAGCAPPATTPRSPSAASLATGPSSPALATIAAPHPELEEVTLAELSARLSRGELSSRALVDAYVARIEALDRAGPALRSVLELNPDAAAIAAQLDEERRARGPRGPLHGIPVLVKDNVDTGDRTQTTAGSLALLGTPAPRDAHVVERLRQAGAVVLGKTNLSEWANIRDSHATSGWSARGGLTRNPYALDRNTSGSSSGSAAAVAASLAAVAVGTETDGSILSPSQICGLVGLKPTVGLVSRAGIIPISHTQDTAGPMARTVTDAAILLGAMAGSDPRDAATAAAHVERDYTRFLDREGARGKRLGVLRLPWVGPTVKPSYEAALDALRRLGATLVDVELKTEELEHAELEVLLCELKVDMAAYLAARGSPLRTLEDLVRFNERHATEELRFFGQDLFEKSLATRGLEDAGYVKALETCRRVSRAEGIDAALAAQKLDAIVGPTGGPAWLSDEINGDAFTGAGYSIASVAGYPSITVPSGASHGLPLGVCFFAGAWAEPLLLSLAFAFEQATRHRTAPRYLASAAL